MVKIQFSMYYHYLSTTGKNRALFGLTESLSYGYKRYYGTLPAIGFIISIIIAIKQRSKELALLASLISLLAIILSIFSIWRMFI